MTASCRTCRTGSLRESCACSSAAAVPSPETEAACTCEGYPPEVGGAIYRPDCPQHAAAPTEVQAAYDSSQGAAGAVEASAGLSTVNRVPSNHRPAAPTEGLSTDECVADEPSLAITAQNPDIETAWRTIAWWERTCKYWRSEARKGYALRDSLPDPLDLAAARVRAEAAADRAAVERVRALHFRRPWRATDGVLFGQTEFPDRCDHCLVGATWPCSTIRALDGADTPATDAQDGAGDAHATRE